MQSALLSDVPASEISLLTSLANQIIRAAEQEQQVQAREALVAQAVFDQSLAQQSATAARVPILAGVSYARQSQRMRNRPLSIAGVRMADANIFYVSNDSQTVTSNKPLLFLESLVIPRTPKEVTSVAPLTPASWDETSNLRKVNLKLTNVKPTTLSETNLKEAAAMVVSEDSTTILPVAFPRQFRTPQYPRRSSNAKLTFTKLARAADPTVLLELVEAKQRREVLRITAKMRAFQPPKKSTFPDAIRSIKTVYAKLSLHSQNLVSYFRRLKKLEKEFFNISR